MEKRTVDRCPVVSCKDVEDLKKEKGELWTEVNRVKEAISNFVTLRILLLILALPSAAYLALFSWSMKMNSTAIAKVERVREEREIQVRALNDAQQALIVGMTQLQGITKSNLEKIDECKKSIRFLDRRVSRFPGGKEEANRIEP